MYSVKQVIKDALSKFWTGYKKNVVDNLTSENANLPLSANMGRELNTKLNNYVITKSFAKLIALSDGRGSADFSNSDIAITGYTPLGIVKYSFATTWFVPTGVNIDGSGAHIGVRHVGSPTASTANANCYITILYVKK